MAKMPHEILYNAEPVALTGSELHLLRDACLLAAGVAEFTNHKIDASDYLRLAESFAGELRSREDA